MKPSKSLLQRTIEIGVILFAFLGGVNLILDIFDKSGRYLGLISSISISLILIISYLIILFLFKRGKIKWVTKDNKLVTIKKLNTNYSLGLIILLVLLWIPWIILILNPFNYLFTILNPDDNKYKILILPFKQECSFNGKSFDIGYVLKERLDLLNKTDSLAVNIIYLNDYEDINNLNEVKLDSILNVHKANYLLYGNYSLKECESDSSDKLCFKYFLKKDLAPRINIDSSHNFDMINFPGLDTIRNGFGQEKLDFIIYWVSGYKFYASGNYNKSLEHWLKASKYNANNQVLNEHIATCYYHLKDYHQTIKYLDLNKDKPLTSLVSAIYPFALAWTGNLPHAMMQLEDLYNKFQKPSIYHKFALILFKELKEFGVSKVYFEKALEINPDMPHLNHNYGALLAFGLKDFKSARNYFLRSLKIDKADSETFYYYGLWFHNQRIYPDSANYYFKKAIKLDDKYIVAYESLAFCLLNDIKNYKDAKSIINKGLKVSSSNFRLLKMKFELDAKLRGDSIEQKSELIALVGLYPNSFEANRDLANYYLSINSNIDSALYYYDYAIKIDSSDEDVLLYYGLILNMKSEELTKAKIILEKLLKLYPYNSKAHSTYASVLLKTTEDCIMAYHHYRMAMYLDKEEHQLFIDGIFKRKCPQLFNRD